MKPVLWTAIATLGLCSPLLGGCEQLSEIIETEKSLKCSGYLAESENYGPDNSIPIIFDTQILKIGNIMNITGSNLMYNYFSIKIKNTIKDMDYVDKNGDKQEEYNFSRSNIIAFNTLYNERAKISGFRQYHTNTISNVVINKKTGLLFYRELITTNKDYKETVTEKEIVARCVD